MHAENRTFGVVFETTVRLLVPLFQRPYVWKQDNNWEPLWDSINTVADRRLDGNNIGLVVPPRPQIRRQGRRPHQ